MRFGLYGKLPSKRDYVALATPSAFLAAWEPWLQGSVAASRMSLGVSWQAAFLRAPIWRFWLGRDVSGAAMTGALMPSVDGVGRYFPLAVFVRAEPGEVLASPEIDARDAWMQQLEDILLSALAPGTTVEGIMAALESLGGPSAGPAAGPPEGVERLSPAAWATVPAADGVAAAAGRLRQADQDRASSETSVWWTQGGGEFAPRLLMSVRFPDPLLFAGMLTGAFPAQSTP